MLSLLIIRLILTDFSIWRGVAIVAVRDQSICWQVHALLLPRRVAHLVRLVHLELLFQMILALVSRSHLMVAPVQRGFIRDRLLQDAKILLFVFVHCAARADCCRLKHRVGWQIVVEVLEVHARNRQPACAIFALLLDNVESR